VLEGMGYRAGQVGVSRAVTCISRRKKGVLGTCLAPNSGSHVKFVNLVLHSSTGTITCTVVLYSTSASLSVTFGRKNRRTGVVDLHGARILYP